QKELLAVQNVKQLDEEGRSFAITYADGKTRQISLPNAMTEEELKAHAQILPDLSVEQTIVSDPDLSQGKASKLFTVRTSEKAPELVQASVDRLLGDEQQRILLKEPPLIDPNV